MFNTTMMNIEGNSVSFNTVSGTLVKSSEKSRIKRFHMHSELADTFFDIAKPYYTDNDYSKHYVVVLQVMLCANEEFLVEFIEVKE